MHSSAPWNASPFLLSPEWLKVAARCPSERVLTELQHLCKRLYSFSLFPSKSAPQLL